MFRNLNIENAHSEALCSQRKALQLEPRRTAMQHRTKAQKQIHENTKILTQQAMQENWMLTEHELFRDYVQAIESKKKVLKNKREQLVKVNEQTQKDVIGMNNRRKYMQPELREKNWSITAYVVAKNPC